MTILRGSLSFSWKLSLLALCLFARPAFATTHCQKLDLPSSQFKFSLEIAGSDLSGLISKAQGWILLDPENLEKSVIRLSVPPSGMHLSNKIEENPLLVGMLNSVLSQPMEFKSSKIAAQGHNEYHVEGPVYLGKKQMLAKFTVSPIDMTSHSSRFQSQLKSKSFDKVLGVPGGAEGNFKFSFIAADSGLCR